MPAKVRSMELVRLLRKIDSDDVYPMMDAYYVHTLNMEIGCEHGADYITLYVPDIYRTAPPDVLEMMLRNAYTSTIDGRSTKKRSDRDGCTHPSSSGHTGVCSWTSAHRSWTARGCWPMRRSHAVRRRSWHSFPSTGPTCSCCPSRSEGGGWTSAGILWRPLASPASSYQWTLRC